MLKTAIEKTEYMNDEVDKKYPKSMNKSLETLKQVSLERN